MTWPAALPKLLPTLCEALGAALDYAEIFLRLQVEWIGYFGIVKPDADDEDNCGESSGAPAL